MKHVATVADARNYKYGSWAGDPDGRKYREGYCIQPVWSGGRGSIQYQCTRKIVKDGFCKQHHPDAVAARDKKSEERYRREMSLIMKPTRIRDIYRKALKAIERSSATAYRLREIAREALEEVDKL